MNKVEKEEQQKRIKRYDELQSKIDSLTEAQRRAYPDGVYELTICEHQLSRCLIGQHILIPIRNDIVAALELQIELLMKEQSKI